MQLCVPSSFVCLRWRHHRQGHPLRIYAIETPLVWSPLLVTVTAIGVVCISGMLDPMRTPPTTGLTLVSLSNDAKLVREALEHATWEKDWRMGEPRPSLAALDRLVARCEEAEAYAKEGWAWLDDALAALGAETVFDIKDKNLSLPVAEAEAARYREALADIAGYGISPNNGYPIVSADVVKVARAALEQEENAE